MKFVTRNACVASPEAGWHPTIGPRFLRKFTRGVSTMMKRTRTAAIAALGLGVALAASACAGGGSSSGNGSSSSGHVTLTFWTNATPGPGLTYFQNAIKTFDTFHPTGTTKRQTTQNEDYDAKLQT